MRVINLFESNELIEIKKFSGGECHIKLLSEYKEDEKIRINTRLNSSDDIMNLCLLVDALRNMYVNYIEVFLPYIPYARQDRVMIPGEPLSIKVFAKIVNSLNLNKVIVFDAHSDVSVALLNNCENIANHKMVEHFLDEQNITNFTLISPDLGAYKKVDKLATKINYHGQIATGIKVRDLSTGKIIKSDINTEDLKGNTCIIVDDICDGGRTFIELAAILKTKNVGDLYLIVSHGIFSHNAIERLKEAGYKNVFSSNSIANLQETTFYKSYNVFQNEI
jgi:ribose-phosphate pyrophosphokinase